jgi:hypothetical protein
VKLTIWAALAASLLLGACASMPIQNWPQNQKPPVGDEAKIIVTGGAPSRCGLRVFLIGVSRPGSYVVLNRVAEANIADGVLKSHFTDHHGRVNVISLKPGRYIVYPLAGGTLQNAGTPPSFQFEAVAGELTYIGELYVDASCGAMSGHVAMFDREARDLAVLKALNPAFADVPVVKRIATPVN